MGSARVDICLPVRIDPTPKSIDECINTLVQDSLIVCATQVAEYMECVIHVSARALNRDMSVSRTSWHKGVQYSVVSNSMSEQCIWGVPSIIVVVRSNVAMNL
jgi:hypothetical protein